MIWGDYQLWALGFKDNQETSAAERYDSMCAEMNERAAQLNIPSRWLRYRDLAALELTNDNWHIARSSAKALKQLLDAMLAPSFFDLLATHGAQRPPSPRPSTTEPRPPLCPQLPEGFLSAQPGEPLPPPPPPMSPLPDEPPEGCSTPEASVESDPTPRPSSKVARVWRNRGAGRPNKMPKSTTLQSTSEIVAPPLVHAETSLLDASSPAPCDASRDLAQDAPELFPTRNKIDAAVQTEPLQLRPVAATVVDAVAQTQRVSLEPTMAWYDTEEGQVHLLLDLFRRGIAIPARPVVDGDDPRPVLRLAPRATRRYAEGQPYWAFPEHARGAAPNSRRDRRRREPLREPPFHAF